MRQERNKKEGGMTCSGGCCFGNEENDFEKIKVLLRFSFGLSAWLEPLLRSRLL